GDEPAQRRTRMEDPHGAIVVAAGCEDAERGRACHAWSVRVLLVDDEERMVAALRRGLTAEGFVVESAPDGVRGLALAQTGEFDALVLDVMLPGLSGYEVVRRLRAADNWLPVLMLSAKDGEYDQAD